MSLEQITELSKDISTLEISEKEKEKRREFQKTLTMSYMYAHEPFATLPPRYRVRRNFRPIPPKFVYGLGISMDEAIPLAIKVKPDHDIRRDPANPIRDHFARVCGRKPTFESVYSHDSSFVLGLANTYGKINEDQVVAASDKVHAELVRLEWPRTQCMWYISEANSLEREDWYSPDVEYLEDDEASAYLSILSARSKYAKSKLSVD